LRAESDERGAFRLSDVPAGEHRVLVRRVGYGPLDTRLTFAPNGTVDRRIFLSPVATLEKVVVEEKRRDLVDFDDNRRIGLGKFLTRDDLEKMRTEPLAAVLERFQGVKVVPGPGSRAWIASRRGVKALRADGVTCPPREDRPPNDRYACECYANVWLDGVLLSRQEIPNIARFTPEQLEGVEYYAGPAETPARYSEMRAACGTVVLHTRRTP
jgi:hypothetical protein